MNENENEMYGTEKLPEFNEFVQLRNKEGIKPLSKLNRFRFGSQPSAYKKCMPSIKKILKSMIPDVETSVISTEFENTANINTNNVNIAVLNIMYYNLLFNLNKSMWIRILNFLFVLFKLQNSNKLAIIFLNHNFLFKSWLYKLFKEEIKYNTLSNDNKNKTKKELKKILNTYSKLPELKSRDYYYYIGIIIYLLIKYNLNNRKKYIDLLYALIQLKNERIIDFDKKNTIIDEYYNK